MVKNPQNYDLICYCDGVSKNNPGEAGIGVIIYDSSNKIINQINEYIGIATNNIAEYSALIKTLQEALKLKAKSIIVYSDSELMVRQIKGEYKTSNEKLKSLRNEVYNLMKSFSGCEIIHINREQNKLADKLANISVKSHRDKS